jgi:hypothetical protein
MLDWIVCSDQLLSEPDSPWFRRLVAILNPDVQTITTNMMNFDLPREVERVEPRIVKLLEVSGSEIRGIRVTVAHFYSFRTTASESLARPTFGRHATNVTLSWR